MRRALVGLAGVGLVLAAMVGIAAAQQFPTPTPDRPLRPNLPAGETPSKSAPVNSGELLVTIEGAKQGKFKGEGNKEATKDKIVGLLYQHDMGVKRDEDGKPTGKARHEVLTITKGIGAASPQIMTAAATGETLKSVVIEMYQGGGGEPLYVVTLGNARIVSVKQFNEKGYFYETVGFGFEKIEVEHRASRTKGLDEGK